ncbi:MAG: type II toxin-antitoxin system prevent-host-death family antitoxin, partial [candidate division WOR-3 bacterium]
RLSELLERVRRGKTYVITRRGRRIAQLRPVSATGRRPRFGCDRGRVTISPDFDAPVPGLEDYER